MSISLHKTDSNGWLCQFTTDDDSWAFSVNLTVRELALLVLESDETTV